MIDERTRARTDDESPLVQAVAISRRGSSPNAWLLRDVSISLKPGERVALVGPTGAGKTLLLRTLALLDPVDEGQVLWNGKPILRNDVPAYRSRVLYLHQRPALIEGTVEENLRLPFRFNHHREVQFDRLRIVAWLETLGRDPAFLDKNTQDLSGGEAQITALLRALQLDPSVLLLDEPTAALDHDSIGLIERLVEQWLDEHPTKRSTLWVSHNREQASRVAQRSLSIRDGVIQR